MCLALANVVVVHVVVPESRVIGSAMVAIASCSTGLSFCCGDCSAEVAVEDCSTVICVDVLLACLWTDFLFLFLDAFEYFFFC